MDKNITKKNLFSQYSLKKVYLKKNEELNLYDTIIEKVVYYKIKEYQKAYDSQGNEIGELKVNEYLSTPEDEIDTYNYLDYKRGNNSPPLGCQTLHFNDELHLVVMHRLVTIDEIQEGCKILNSSQILDLSFDYDYSFFPPDKSNGFKIIGEWREKEKSVPPG